MSRDSKQLEEMANDELLKEHRMIDWHLQQLVSLVNKSGASMDITLIIGGTIISGLLVGGRDYFTEVARNCGQGEINKAFATSLMEYAKIYTYPDESGEEKLSLDLPSYIHLKNAQISQASGTIPIIQGALWRGRLASVDGFILGLIEAN